MNNTTDYEDIARFLRCRRGKRHLRKYAAMLQGRTVTNVSFSNEGRCIAATLALDDDTFFVVYDPSLVAYELRERFGDAIEDEYYRELSAKRRERKKKP